MEAVFLIIEDIVKKINRAGKKRKYKKCHYACRAVVEVEYFFGKQQRQKNKEIFDPLLGPEAYEYVINLIQEIHPAFLFKYKTPLRIVYTQRSYYRPNAGLI